MRLLLITTLYPNAYDPTRATYNRSLVRALSELGHEVRVIAPVPWCPIIDPLLRHRRLPPPEEEIDGTRVIHPRFLYTPGLLVRRRHLQYRRGVAPPVRRVLREVAPDHVFLGFAYPDAAALAPLCRDMGVSWSVMVLGSDFRIRTRQPGFRELVLNTLRHAPLLFCPGQALRRDMIAAGIDGDKIVAFNNGIDHGVFHPGGEKEVNGGSRGGAETADGEKTARGETQDAVLAQSRGDRGESGGNERLCGSPAITPPASNRTKLGLRGSRVGDGDISVSSAPPREQPDFSAPDAGIGTYKTVLFVGNLVHVKGVDRLLRALGHVPEARLVLIGDGRERRRLQRLAAELDIADRVQFLGRKSREEVADWMRNADCLCLPSRSEGMPNVVLEALACGTPVVGTDVGEVRFVVREGVSGRIVSGTDEEEVVAGLTVALKDALSRRWVPAEIAATVADFTWQAAADTVIRALHGKR